jgi:site-specific DNA-methyltransferase (adenine-specific)
LFRRKVGHPAPFPVELPHRLIQLYTFKDDVILDPFCGSGSTCIAALETGRHYIGYDNEEKYVSLAEKRIKEFKEQQFMFPFVEKEGELAVVREPQRDYA